MKNAVRIVYVKIMRLLRILLSSLGVTRWLERRDGRWAKWFRSLLAIYDIDDMVHLDIPWWSFDAIDAVDKKLSQTQNARVFEWGSGASTVWLAKRAGEVISVEHDPSWAEIVKPRLEPFDHVRTIQVPSRPKGAIPSGKFGFEGQYFDDYVAAINNVEGDFDLIVIDGRAREACLQVAINRLKPGGHILFDDFKRRRYQDAVSALGLKAVSLDGLAACLPLPDSTALISQDD
ncbi:class I SAM-dependent methyltransferase [Aliiroseovarius sp. F20344]|uniref:class I SAM-dependent methyltransferase n=1 Tax=Aliiroseovarius sp. F20344 TaxID=2926414 RepID=UPI001FF21569|nr:class I SAM-dependent methyltransferase [Aliiroseovarius sp. F20344]